MIVSFVCVFFLMSTVIASADISTNGEVTEISENSCTIKEKEKLERIDFIHYAKPEKTEKMSTNTDKCYKLLGIKWKSMPVNYVINPSLFNVSEDFVEYAISTSAETWDDSTQIELLNDTYLVNNSAIPGIQDFVNVLGFVDYPSDNVIAVTNIWYNSREKKIVEFDIRFNTGSSWSWGNASDLNSSLMDIQNIATHEFGHGIGLGDVYRTACRPVTMFGYSLEGDIVKRTLEPADINGLQKMYGV